uniref:Uncharacterized protein n=1 Tax=Meloidogyne enterolobii TaxID=390850 RepID=A0A6V7TKR6_MELEN|nr:unnamed protein product [Meloidogyne enterolobii]
MSDTRNIPIKFQQPFSSTSSQQQSPQQPQPQQKPSSVDRLRQLEAEITIEAAGMRLPDDDALTEKLGNFLAEKHPQADLQITVNSVRRTITTKQQYETETPGMVGLNVEKLLELQRKLMEKISANKIEPAKDASANLEDEKKEKEEEWARREHPEIQQFEQIQESFPVDDTTMVTKKRTHIISTSQSRIKGLDEFASAAPSAGAAGGYSPQSSPAETTISS